MSGHSSPPRLVNLRTRTEPNNYIYIISLVFVSSPVSLTISLALLDCLRTEDLLFDGVELFIPFHC